MERTSLSSVPLHFLEQSVAVRCGLRSRGARSYSASFSAVATWAFLQARDKAALPETSVLRKELALRPWPCPQASASVPVPGCCDKRRVQFRDSGHRPSPASELHLITTQQSNCTYRVCLIYSLSSLPSFPIAGALKAGPLGQQHRHGPRPHQKCKTSGLQAGITNSTNLG